MGDIEYWDTALTEDAHSIQSLLSLIPNTKDAHQRAHLLEETKNKLRSAQQTKRSLKLECRLLSEPLQRKRYEEVLLKWTNTLGALTDAWSALVPPDLSASATVPQAQLPCSWQNKYYDNTYNNSTISGKNGNMLKYNTWKNGPDFQKSQFDFGMAARQNYDGRQDFATKGAVTDEVRDDAFSSPTKIGHNDGPTAIMNNYGAYSSNSNNSIHQNQITNSRRKKKKRSRLSILSEQLSSPLRNNKKDWRNPNYFNPSERKKMSIPKFFKPKNMFRKKIAPFTTTTTTSTTQE